MLVYGKEEPVTDNLITWVFDEGSFVPCAKLVNGESFSIITDHLGTPYEAYDEEGQKVWTRELDLYGNAIAGDSSFIPFLYQGQYEDIEIGLYYNRFRYYSPESGTYISQDPIGLEGNNPNFYGYTFDSNTEVDIFGLAGTEGAYMIKLSDGKIYVGKGEIGRMNESIEERTNKEVEIDGKKQKRTVVGKAHMSTNGDNELGKAVEYKALENEGAYAKSGKNKAYIPKDRLENSIVTGSTAYKNLTKDKRLEADRLAKELREELDKDIKKKHH